MVRSNRRDSWVTRVSRTRTLPPTTRLFLSVHLARGMKADGFVSTPRKTLANQAGITPRRVSQHLQLAKEGGWLDPYKPGYIGQTAEFYATIPDQQRMQEPCTLSEPQEGERTQHPLRGKNLSPSRRQEGERTLHPTSSSTTRPHVLVRTYRETDTNSRRYSMTDRRGCDRLVGIYGEELIADRSAPDLELLVASVGAPLSERRVRHLEVVSA